MRKIAIMSAAIVLAVFSGPARPQSVLEIAAGIKFCKTLTDDAQRLKCFDGLFAEKQQPAAALPPQTEMTWSIDDSKSPIDDSPQVVGTLLADGSNPVSSAVLVLRCKEKKTEAFFAKQFSFFGTANSIKVLVRINDGKPIETTWNPSSNGQGVFAPAAVQFIRALPDDGKLFIRATSFDGAQVDGAFTLGKISEVRDRIAADCRWPATPSAGR